MSLERAAAPQASFVFPVYNAESFLARNLAAVRAFLAARPEAWEIVIVDDASSDRTGRIVEEFVSRHAGEAVRGIRFTGNRGKGFAIRAGLLHARAPIVLFTDCDLAYPLENVDRIVRALESGAEAAVACRVLAASTYLISPSFFSYLYTRHLMGRAFNLLCRVMTVPRLLDTQAGLKGFRTAVVRPLLGRLVMDGFSFDVELMRGLMDRGVRIVEVPVAFRYDSEPSTVVFALDSARMFRDLVRIRARSMRGRYGRSHDVEPPPRLVIHADDYGLAPGINRGIEEGLESGVVTSASILLGSPHAGEALAWAAAHPGYDFGVHLNATRGRPVLPTAQVSSLVGDSGEFLPLRGLLARLVTGRVRLSEVRAEWEAQVRVVRDAGVPISHLNSHEHVHLVPGVFSRVTDPIARDLAVPVRGMDGLVRGRRGWPSGKALALAIATRLGPGRDGGARSIAHGFGTQFAQRPSLRVLRTAISRMRPGSAYEMVVHPGRVDDGLLATGDVYLSGREAENAMIHSPEFRALLAFSGVALLDFRRLALAPGD